MGKEITIWTSEPDYEDVRKEMEEDFPEMSEADRIAIFKQGNLDCLQFQREELSMKLGMPIFVVAELGLWDGIHMAYKEIDSGQLADCFEPNRDTLSIRWFVDDKGDLRCDDMHHDGVNHYLYRVIRRDVPQSEIEYLKNVICDGTAFRSEIERCTERLGDAISAIYGFDLPQPERQAERGRTR